MSLTEGQTGHVLNDRNPEHSCTRYSEKCNWLPLVLFAPQKERFPVTSYLVEKVTFAIERKVCDGHTYAHMVRRVPINRGIGAQVRHGTHQNSISYRIICLTIGARVLRLQLKLFREVAVGHPAALTAGSNPAEEGNSSAVGTDWLRTSSPGRFHAR